MIYVHVTFEAEEEGLRFVNVGAVYEKYQVGKQKDNDTQKAQKEG